MDPDETIEEMLSDDPLTRVRALHRSVLTRPSLQTKLRVVGGISGVAAVAVALVVAVRMTALRAVLGVAPLEAAVSASLLLAAGLKFLTLGACLLVLAAYLHGRAEMTESRARRLLGIETTGLFLGVGPGALGTLAGLLALLWLATGTVVGGDAGGLLRLERLARPVPLPVTYGVVLVWAGAVATGALAVSLVVDSDGE